MLGADSRGSTGDKKARTAGRAVRAFNLVILTDIRPLRAERLGVRSARIIRRLRRADNPRGAGPLPTLAFRRPARQFACPLLRVGRMMMC